MLLGHILQAWAQTSSSTLILSGHHNSLDQSFSHSPICVSHLLFKLQHHLLHLYFELISLLLNLTKYCMLTHIWNLEKWYRWTYFQGRNRGTDVDNGLVDKRRERGGRMGWEIGLTYIEYIYTYIACIYIHTYTNMHKIASGNLPYSTGSSAWCSLMT